MPPDDGTERHAILPAERMVAHEGIEPAVVLVGEVFLTLHFKGHVEIFHTFLKPFHAFLVAALP